MRALLIVDMIHDFVDGKFGSDAAASAVPKIRELAEKFQNIIFLCDSHHEGDPELSMWGEHAMEGTKGAEIVDELKPIVGHIIKKNTYDGFFQTELDRTLKERGVEEVYLCGVATDICVMHTAFGAFARGYRVHIIEDACAGTTPDAHEWALNYMERIYGAKIIRSDEI